MSARTSLNRALSALLLAPARMRPAANRGPDPRGVER